MIWKAILLRAYIPHLFLFVIPAAIVLRAFPGDEKPHLFIRGFVLSLALVLSWAGTWACLGGLHVKAAKKKLPSSNEPELPIDAFLDSLFSGCLYLVVVAVLTVVVAVVLFVVMSGLPLLFGEGWFWRTLVLTLLEGSCLGLCLLLGLHRRTFNKYVRPGIERRAARQHLREFYQEKESYLQRDISSSQIEAYISTEMHDKVTPIDAWKAAQEMITRLQTIITRQYEFVEQQRQYDLEQQRQLREQQAANQLRTARLQEMDGKIAQLRNLIAEASRHPDPELGEIKKLEHEATLRQLLDEREILLSSTSGEDYGNSPHSW